MIFWWGTHRGERKANESQRRTENGDRTDSGRDNYYLRRRTDGRTGSKTRLHSIERILYFSNDNNQYSGTPETGAAAGVEQTNQRAAVGTARDDHHVRAGMRYMLMRHNQLIETDDTGTEIEIETRETNNNESRIMMRSLSSPM